MNREEFVLSMRPTINNLLRKYHHYGDEDLFQIAMVDVIVGYNRCIKDGILDIEQQQKMCNTYAKYAILHELEKRNRDYDVLDNIDDDVDEPGFMALDDIDIKLSLDKMLNEEEKVLLSLLYAGYDRKHIIKKLGISEKTFYNKKAKLYEKIKKVLQK